MAELKFEQISPADFFYKNRDIAGFSSPGRSLYMAVRELVENSFPENEPILVRKNGKIRLEKIGEFVERYLENGADVTYENRYYKNIRSHSIEILSLDEQLKLCFKPVTTVFKHPSPSQLWEITTQVGRTVRTTSTHNVFILDRDSRVHCVPTKDLEIGDRLITAVGPFMSADLKEIDLLEQLLSLPLEKTSDMIIHGIAQHYPLRSPLSQKIAVLIGGREEVSWEQLSNVIENIAPRDSRRKNDMIQYLRRAGYLTTKEKGRYTSNTAKVKRKFYAINRDWIRWDYVPLNFFRENRPATIPEKITFSVKQGKKRLPRKIKVSKELMRILGYYASEGSIHDHYKISFSFGSHERGTFAEDLIACLRTVFDITPIISFPHSSAVNVTINDATLAFLLEDVFETGTNSSNKRVPWLVFNVASTLAEEFLQAYVNGDGYIQNKKGDRKITLATSSKELFTGLKFLLTFLGRRFTSSYESGGKRTINGVETTFAPSYSIYIRQGLHASVDNIPIAKVRRHLLSAAQAKHSNFYNDSVNRYWLKKAVASDSLPSHLRTLINADVGALEITRIQQIPAPSPWVYDIAVADVERFVGGECIGLLHNSLDGADFGLILPDIHVDLSVFEEREGDVKLYKLRVEDNGVGVEEEHIPRAFATVLYGSKYGYRQTRGTFGLGGTMALLYGQITTNKPATVVSSTGRGKIHEFSLMVDIVENKPRIFEHKAQSNPTNWHGTIVDFVLEADYAASKSKIVEYLKQTAIANPHARFFLIDPRGRMYLHERFTEQAPQPSKETLPHPVGVDVETLSRLLSDTKARTLTGFLTTSFQKIGRKTAEDILKQTSLDPSTDPNRLDHSQVTALYEAIRSFGKFRSPDPAPLSPIGGNFLETGIKTEFKPDFLFVVQREPSAYSGFPFLVEVALAYGGSIQPSENFHLFRFANKIPLLYDERADVSWKVISEKIDWNNYKVPKPAPLAIFTSICSPKVPYKTVGKEAIADRPEIERELTIAIREAGRNLKLHLSRVAKREASKKRFGIYAKYLPKIAEFSAKLADKRQPPDVKALLEKMGIGPELLEKLSQEKSSDSEETQN